MIRRLYWFLAPAKTIAEQSQRDFKDCLNPDYVRRKSNESMLYYIEK